MARLEASHACSAIAVSCRRHLRPDPEDRKRRRRLPGVPARSGTIAADIRVEAAAQALTAALVEARVLRQGYRAGRLRMEGGGQGGRRPVVGRAQGSAGGRTVPPRVSRGRSRHVAAVAERPRRRPVGAGGTQSNMEGVGNLEDLPRRAHWSIRLDMTGHVDGGRGSAAPARRSPPTASTGAGTQGEVAKLEGEELSPVDRRARARARGPPFALENGAAHRRARGPDPVRPRRHLDGPVEPDLRDRGGDSLYGAMLRRIRLAGGRVARRPLVPGRKRRQRKAAAV